MNPFWIPIYLIPAMALSLYHGIQMSVQIPENHIRVILQLLLILSAGAVCILSIIHAHKTA